jgi:predicted unusual protein kinase regulating ubiquinone biosynthesis (AarF/ABC1/UbiB family)
MPATLSIWGKIWKAVIHIIRFFHLLLIFSPPILLFPLLFFKRTEDYWRSLFVTSVERAGVVFIKTFQYLSHRRDIIGP